MRADFLNFNKTVFSQLSGQTHYKCIQHKIAVHTRFPGSKSRNNALHADCCKVTIELPAHAVASIFLGYKVVQCVANEWDALIFNSLI